MSVAEKIQTQLSIMSELCRLLKKENTLLQEQRQDECKELLEQKEKLSFAYADGFKAITKNKENFAALSEQQKGVLRKAAMTLKMLTDENKRLLEINKDAISRLLNAMKKDVEEQSRQTPLYNAEGAIYGESGHPVALSYNSVH